MRSLTIIIWICSVLGSGCSLIDCECGTNKVLKVKSLEFRAAQTEPTPGYTAKESGVTSFPLFVSDTVALDDSDINEADARMEDQQVTLLIRLTDEGRVKLRELSREQLNNEIAIIADNRILMAPVVQEVVDQGEFKVTGNLTMDEACGIVCLIKDSREKSGK